MVSSTYYDLKDIRLQLAHFLQDDLGYRALISEAGSFPIDPDADTVENCRRRVEANADILVLVIGERYGSIEATSGKSITNLEYLGARAKGIPIYAFVDSRVNAVYSKWRSLSPEQRTEIGDAIGDVKLFQFIESVRVSDSVWMNDFQASADLIATLRLQLAYLSHDALEIRRAVVAARDKRFLLSLGPSAFRLAVEHPSLWEYRLFGQVLNDEVAALEDQRREYDLGFAYGPSVSVRTADMNTWIQARFSELRRLIDAANELFGAALPDAFGPPGTPGDAPKIVFVARQVARVYRELLEWTSLVRRIHTGDAWSDALSQLVDFTSLLVPEIGSFGGSVLHQIDQAEAESRPLQPGESQRILTLTLNFRIPDVKPLIAAMERAAAS